MAAFSNRKIQIASFSAENCHKNRRQVAAFSGVADKVAALPRFQNRRVFRTTKLKRLLGRFLRVPWRMFQEGFSGSVLQAGRKGS